jgi:hypothetical protein
MKNTSPTRKILTSDWHIRDTHHDAVFLDTDVVVRKDLTPIFDENFDIGLTIRLEPIMDLARRRT